MEMRHERRFLLEFMARHSDSPDYRELATDAYKNATIPEVEKLKLRRAAERTGLFSEVQRIDSDERSPRQLRASRQVSWMAKCP